MARFSMNDADNYGGNGNGGSFFTLKDDKDTARVRFLYNSVDDVEGYAVHRVAVGDKERYVNCLRSYNEPIDKCPFCSAGIKVQPRLFVKLYNEDAGECQIWERGKTFFSVLSGLSNRYNPLCDEIIEIERNGKKGDMHTTYQPYPIENSPVNLDDFEPSEPLGTIILDKSFDEMQDYLNTGSFPDDGQQVSQARSNSREQLEDRPVRRTPSNNNGNIGRRAF